jgi:hypothetical protein
MSNFPISSKTVERRFLEAIKHHLKGWATKVEKDFSLSAFNSELQNLKDDPVYSKFAFDCPEYVLVRLVGRMSISIGRRLGEIYDKLPRFVAGARFNISPDQIAEKFNGLELDIGLRFSSLTSEEDKSHVRQVLSQFGKKAENFNGVGIEIRYNFNPNDSARLRKDISMVEYLNKSNLFPVYLIYSSISPRNDAISRLTRAGWYFLQGTEASNFTTNLFTIDFLEIMERPEVKKEIQSEVRGMMSSIFNSEAFKEISRK